MADPGSAAHHSAGTFGDDGAAPNTCMCYCLDCWDDRASQGLGRCICPDCQNPHHDHRARAAS